MKTYLTKDEEIAVFQDDLYIGKYVEQDVTNKLVFLSWNSIRPIGRGKIKYRDFINAEWEPITEEEVFLKVL